LIRQGHKIIERYEKDRKILILAHHVSDFQQGPCFPTPTASHDGHGGGP
jgi:hypothetical protein